MADPLPNELPAGVSCRKLAMLADGTPDPGAKPPYARKVGDEMPLKRELGAFLAYLEGAPPPRSSAAEGLLVVERIAEVRRLLGLGSA